MPTTSPTYQASGFWDWFPKLLPSIITGGTVLTGAVLQSKALGKATDVSVEAGTEAARLQAQTAREQLELARQIYNQDVGLVWPQYVTSTGALKKLARGTGIKTPEGLFDVPAKPPALGGFTSPGGGTGSVLDTVAPPAGTPSIIPPQGSIRPEGTLKPVLRGGFSGAGLGILAGGVAGGALAGAGAGTIAGLPAGPVGMAVGAGMGALTGLVGRGRKEANQIVPTQNTLTSEAARVVEILKGKEQDGTVTAADWQAGADYLSGLKDQFNSFVQPFGRAGPGAQQTMTWMDPMLEDWRQKAAALTPKAGGGSVGGFLHPNRYLVGEKGPEILEMAPSSEGYVYPNSALKRVLARGAGGPVHGQDKVHIVMSEFKRGKLRSSSGQKVRSRRQAIAIAMSEAGLARRQAGGWVYGLPPFNAADPTAYYAALKKAIETNPELRAQYDASYRAAQVIPGQPQPTTQNTLDYLASQLPQEKALAPFSAPATPKVNQLSMQSSSALEAPGVATAQPEVAQLSMQTSGGSPAGFSSEPITGTITGNQPPSSPDASRNVIRQWGWYQDGQGQWVNVNGDRGYWTAGGQFINATQGKIFNPQTEQVSGFKPGGFSLPRNPYAEMQAPYEEYEGEFMQPWQGQFSFDPASAGFQSFNQPFNFNPQVEGYTQFNKPFSFDTADLYKDPGYNFRLNESLKAIERRAAAGGYLQSGATMKALGRYAGDYASNEYANAYARALGEFQLGQGQTTAAYGRRLGEFGLGYGQTGDAYNRAQVEYERVKNEFLDNQIRRRNWLAAMAGLTSGGE